MTVDPVASPDAPGPHALLAELPDLSTRDLEGVVTKLCSAYGTVVKVVVHIAEGHSRVQAFALVDMAQPGEAELLATAFNRSRVGSAVVLLLQPRPVE